MSLKKYLSTYSGGEHATTEPYSEPLHVVRNYVYVDGLWLESTLAQLNSPLCAVIRESLYISLKSLAEVFEHGRTTTKHNVLHQVIYNQEFMVPCRDHDEYQLGKTAQPHLQELAGE